MKTKISSLFLSDTGNIRINILDCALPFNAIELIRFKQKPMMNRITAHHRFLCFYKVLAYKAAKLKIFAEPLIQFRAFGKAAVDEADRLDGRADNGLVVGQAEDVLNENVFDALLAQGKA